MQKSSTRYSQIAAYYQERIDAGELVEGNKMPTEEEIGRLFNVSRITVRQAMNELAQAGYIVRMQGKGSFVRMKKADMQLNHLQGFSEEMRAMGMEPSSELRSGEIIACDPKVAQKLQVEPESQVFSLLRVRYADGAPMAVEHVHVPFYLCPTLLSHDLNGSLYKVLLEHYQLEPLHAMQDIEAGLASRQIAELLRIKPTEPSLIIERVSYLRGEVPLEYVISVYRGDRYAFHVDMHRDARGF